MTREVIDPAELRALKRLRREGYAKMPNEGTLRAATEYERTRMGSYQQEKQVRDSGLAQKAQFALGVISQNVPAERRDTELETKAKQVLNAIFDEVLTEIANPPKPPSEAPPQEPEEFEEFALDGAEAVV
jgi:hypothetical protein